MMSPVQQTHTGQYSLFAVFNCCSSPLPEVMSRLVATSLKLLMASSRATLSNMLLLLMLLLLLERGGGVTSAVAGWGLQQLGSSAMVCRRRRWGLAVITSSTSAQ